MADKRPADQQLQTALRRAQVLRLRLAGVQFADIGAQLDPPVSDVRAYQLYRDALTQIVREPGEQVIKADLERLDLLWRSAITHAMAGSIGHIEVCLKVLARRARLLGLDAPVKAELRWSKDEVSELDREIEALLSAWPRGQWPHPDGRELPADGRGDPGRG
jgi:hypothetical protein